MPHRTTPSSQVSKSAIGLNGVALDGVRLTGWAWVPVFVAGWMGMTGVSAQVQDASTMQDSSAAANSTGRGGAGAQTTGRRGVYFEPRVSGSEVLTDNSNLSNANKRSESITTLTAGVRAGSDSGRIRGYFDYSLNKLIYSRSQDKNSTQNSLNTFGSAELVDNWAFIDASANISRQAISAFGTQTPDGSLINSNSTEVANYRISPYVRGRAFGALNYEARYMVAGTRSKSTAASDMNQNEASVRVGSDSSFSRFSWSADFSHQEVDYSLGRDTESDRLRVILNYALSPQLGVYAIAGQENNNYATVNKESHGSGGAGVNWRLSERTKVGAEFERRFFARTHRITFEHRTPRTIWRYLDTKDVTTNPSQGALGTIGTLYDLFFAQFASIQPDPILRAQMVNAFLQANGLNPNAPAGSGFLASGVSVQRRQDLSVALLGVRDTITFLASRSQNQRLDGVVTTGDDLSLAPSVEQRSLSVSYSHRLSPDSSLNVVASHQKTPGAAGLAGSTLKTVNVSVSSRLGLKVTGTLGARRAVFDGASNPYTENAVTGTLNVQF
jgi:uncharacterized protein (PEP-CTERM system associated)